MSTYSCGVSLSTEAATGQISSQCLAWVICQMLRHSDTLNHIGEALYIKRILLYCFPINKKSHATLISCKKKHTGSNTSARPSRGEKRSEERGREEGINCRCPALNAKLHVFNPGKIQQLPCAMYP